MKRDITKRHTTFFNSDPGLLSERARIIFSNPIDAKKVAKSIRANLRGAKGNKEDLTFRLTKETEKRLLEAATQKPWWEKFIGKTKQ